MSTTTFGPLRGYISGRWETQEVWIDGQIMYPAESHESIGDSTGGFKWSYYGSGASQLSFAILQHLTGTPFALKHYDEFKKEFIEKLPTEDFAIDIDEVRQWIIKLRSVELEREVHHG